MRSKRIVLGAVALVVAGPALVSCSKTTLNAPPGSEKGASTTTGHATTTAAASTTAAATTEPATTVPATTAAPATTAGATTAAKTTPATTVPAHKLYDKVAGPTVPSGHTSAVKASGTLADGRYWVIYNGGETQTPDIDVLQAFFGAECQTEAAKHGETCDNDIYVPSDPDRNITNMAFAPNVLLTVADSSTQKSYWITPDELRKIRASSPSQGAPDGFSFTPFPFIMTVKGGKITKFEQLWTP